MTSSETAQIIIGSLSFLATLSIGLIAIRFTNKFSHKTDQFNKDSIFHQLFRDFNSRYSKVNFSLQELLEKSKDDSYTLQNLNDDAELRDKMMDYFNICAEELYWKKKGRIPDDVWNAWKIGMDSWYNEIPILQELWKEEISGEGYKSYYLNEGENLFQEFKSRK